MRVLVVGGAGYVGGHLVDALQKNGHDVTVFDALLYEDQYLKPIKFVFGDIRDDMKIRTLIASNDIVVWLAALVGDPACAIDPQLTTMINYSAFCKATENFFGPLIFMSTCSVYGAQDSMLDENSQTNPLSAYAVTKLQSEKYLEGRPDTLILRLGTLFGIGDYWSRLRLDLAVNVLTLKAYSEKKLTMFGGEQWRPFLHVKDVGEIIAANLDNFISGTFNLASENITISNLVNKILIHLPNTEITTTEISFQDARNYRVSTAKAQEQLSLPPSRDIDFGITEILTALREGRVPNPSASRFKNETALKMLWER